jgi:hypothetical protein
MDDNEKSYDVAIQILEKNKEINYKDSDDEFLSD